MFILAPFKDASVRRTGGRDVTVASRLDRRERGQVGGDGEGECQGRS